MTYSQEVRAARARYEDAIEEAEEGAAADALKISEDYDRPLKTVCREIAGSKWQAVESKARRATRDPKARDRDIRQGQLRAVRALVKAEPDVVAREVAKVDPQAVLEAATEVRGSQPKLAKQELSIPARSMDLAWTHVKGVVEYIQEGRLTAGDRKELKRVTPRVIKGAEFILEAVEGTVGEDVDSELQAMLGNS